MFTDWTMICSVCVSAWMAVFVCGTRLGEIGNNADSLSHFLPGKHNSAIKGRLNYLLLRQENRKRVSGKNPLSRS